MLDASPQPVTQALVQLYGESLCPDCRRFIEDVASLIAQDQAWATALRIQYVAFGKARLNESSGGVECQHGEQECYFNRWILCAQALAPSQETW